MRYLFGCASVLLGLAIVLGGGSAGLCLALLAMPFALLLAFGVVVDTKS